MPGNLEAEMAGQREIDEADLDAAEKVRRRVEVREAADETLGGDRPSEHRE